MTRPRVHVTRPIAEEALARLRAAAEVTTGPADRESTRKELLDLLAPCEGLLVVGHPKVDGELMDAAPKLRMIANFGVGVDHIDVAAATKRGVWVSNTAGSLTETTAELAWALILAATRRIAEGDRLVRANRWKGFGPFFFLGTELPGKTLGIVGAGRIGQSVARRAAAFGMSALYWSRGAKKEFETATGAAYRDLDALLRESDVVVLTVSLTAETRHLIGARELGLMKSTATLVNIARGPVVDEAALSRALLDRTISSAGLDVYEKEPEVHPDLLRCENAVLVPHIGSATIETRRRMSMLAVENCLAGVQGRTPPLLLNPDAQRGLKGE
ncbi:MAG: D-glycerate dehydrogenase [Planctomycetaceae bacterium]|nr:D-glycerate dehydrogenase [Planctomycetaceae bacterium]